MATKPETPVVDKDDYAQLRKEFADLSTEILRLASRGKIHFGRVHTAGLGFTLILAGFYGIGLLPVGLIAVGGALLIASTCSHMEARTDKIREGRCQPPLNQPYSSKHIKPPRRCNYCGTEC